MKKIRKTFAMVLIAAILLSSVVNVAVYAQTTETNNVGGYGLNIDPDPDKS